MRTADSSLSHEKQLLFSRSVATPWIAARQASLPSTISQNLFKFMSIELMMPPNHLTLCHPLLLFPSIFPVSEFFHNESAPMRSRLMSRWAQGCKQTAHQAVTVWGGQGDHRSSHLFFFKWETFLNGLSRMYSDVSSSIKLKKEKECIPGSIRNKGISLAPRLLMN